MQFLAILRVKPETTREQLGPLLKPEAAKAWEMHTAGVLRSAHFLEGGGGAVLMLEASSRAEAEAHLNQLPLVGNGVVNLEILPLRPFIGYASLFAPPAS